MLSFLSLLLSSTLSGSEASGDHPPHHELRQQYEHRDSGGSNTASSSSAVGCITANTLINRNTGVTDIGLGLTEANAEAQNGKKWERENHPNAMIGNAKCTEELNIEACSFDGGACKALDGSTASISALCDDLRDKYRISTVH
eukprot:scaffold6229_cov178-Chaetoceros_neogracile.AAC.4